MIVIEVENGVVTRVLGPKDQEVVIVDMDDADNGNYEEGEMDIISEEVAFKVFNEEGAVELVTISPENYLKQGSR